MPIVRGGEERAQDADAVRVGAGEERRARRRADRLRHVEVGEAHALGGQPVDVRRADARRAVDADVAVAEVVGVHEDDVRRAVGRRCRPGSLGGKASQDEAPEGRRLLGPSSFHGRILRAPPRRAPSHSLGALVSVAEGIGPRGPASRMPSERVRLGIHSLDVTLQSDGYRPRPRAETRNEINN